METDNSLSTDSLEKKSCSTVMNGILKSSNVCCTDYEWNGQWMTRKRRTSEPHIKDSSGHLPQGVENETIEFSHPYKKCKSGAIHNTKMSCIDSRDTENTKKNKNMNISADSSDVLSECVNSSCSELLNNNSSKSSVLCDSFPETVYRSRYGRLQKGPALSPDMELVPLIRCKRSQKPRSPIVSGRVIHNLSVNSPESIFNDCSSPEYTKFSTSSLKDPSPISIESSSSKQKIENNNNESLLKLQISPIGDRETKWLVGDLLWSKITGHPYWPCMVSYDPVKGIYTKVVQTKFKKPHRLYHVQYFGDEAQHGWTLPFSIMPFEGQAYFDAVLKMIESSSCSKIQKQKLLNKYQVKPSRIRSWDIAVKEAEDALKMTRSERKQLLTFEYIMDGTKSKYGERCVSSHFSKPPPQTLLKKLETSKKTKPLCEKRSFGPKNEMNSTTGGEIKKLSQLQTIPKKKSLGNFSVFVQKHMHKVKLEQPFLKKYEAEEYLFAQWQKMNVQQRACYTSRFSTVSKKRVTSQVTGHNGTIIPDPRLKEVSGCKKKGTEVFSPDNKMSNCELDKTFKIDNGICCDQEKDKNFLSPFEQENVKKIKVEQNYLDDLEDEMHETNQEQKTFSVNEKVSSVNGLLNDEMKGAKNVSETCIRSKKKVDVMNASLGVEELNDCHQDSDNIEISSSDLSHDLVDLEPSSAVGSRQEKICQICEKSGDVISCKGLCQHSFHLDCLGLTCSPSDFYCDECFTGNHTCFACKSSEGFVRKCTLSTCGKFYHEHCLKLYPLTARVEGRTIICPLHACLACYIENPKHPRLSRSRLVRCLRCPTAYHMGDSCIAAGSISVSSQIVCAGHFQARKGRHYQSHINVNWCFICSIGGSLICCETCPAAFHAECLQIQTPEGSYFCEDCTAGKHPHYGEIVWVKLGCYRWWPAEICHPRSVPQNIQNMPHGIGEFPIKFFGSRDYYWTHRGRVFLFHEGDKGSKESASNKNLAKVFQKALIEANEAFHLWQTKKAAKVAQESERNTKPPPYKHIKVNKPVGKVQIYSADLSQLNRCDCDPSSENPCGSDSDCLNRMMMFECHLAVCKAKDKCQNQRFQKRQYVATVPFKTEGRGWGLKTLEDVKKGEFVIEYVGELIDEENCQARLKKMQEDNDTNFYFLTIDKDRIIDAGPKGNLARFMNHSCRPNCETQKWLVNGDTRVGLFALCDIPAGMELNFNYNLDCRGTEKTKCVCGAPNCSDFIGIRPKAAAVTLQEKKIKETTRKKKRRLHPVRVHEDDCFRCGEGGELVMCDRKGCPKAYHLNCLSLTKPPHGRWECPWHHCDVCGKPSSVLCPLCPNSFCKYHHTEDRMQNFNGQIICDEHEELENVDQTESIHKE